MSATTAPSSAWPEQVNWVNALDFPLDSGIPDQSAGRVIPIAFQLPTGQETEASIWAVAGDGSTVQVPMEHAGLIPFTHKDLGEGRDTFLFRHRKAGSPVPEDKYRIVRIDADTEFCFGIHPDHPEQEGIYLRVRHIGSATLNLSEVVLLDPADVALKFFPIGPAAGAGMPGVRRIYGRKQSV